MRSGAIAVVTATIRIYQLVVSPLLGNRCRFYPSCSEYALGSIRSFGILRGSVLAAWRLLRCNPWNLGGVDFPREQTLFADAHDHGRTAEPGHR